MEGKFIYQENTTAVNLSIVIYYLFIFIENIVNKSNLGDENDIDNKFIILWENIKQDNSELKLVLAHHNALSLLQI